MNGQVNPDFVTPREGSDLGRLLRLDPETGEAQTLVTGLRNPQGLAFDRDGRLWETEHGPQGGDEINVLVFGRDYGWPRVTLGVDYGTPRNPWPFNPVQGAHESGEKPVFAFVPSIGPSNLVQVDARMFPEWDGDLLLCSLRAQSLFHLRVAGDRVIYSERITFDDRLRDIVVLPDGRIAILTDTMQLLLLSTAAGDARPGALRIARVVRGYEALRGPSAAQAALVASSAADESGRIAFQMHCASCHGASRATGIGPPLERVVGRPVGAVQDYAYSPARGRGAGRWTEVRLRRFLLDPQAEFAGTKMPAQMLEPAGVDAVIAYLKQL